MSIGTPDREVDDEDDDQPSVPGRLNTNFVAVPAPVPDSPRGRTSFGPHLTPSKEFEVSDRISVGVLGHADRPNFKTLSQGGIERALRSPASAIRGKDAGVGLSIEFKLGK